MSLHDFDDDGLGQSYGAADLIDAYGPLVCNRGTRA